MVGNVGNVGWQAVGRVNILLALSHIVIMVRTTLLRMPLASVLGFVRHGITSTFIKGIKKQTT